MWIKCLAEGQKYRAKAGIRTRTLSVRVERSLHYTTAPPHKISHTHSCSIHSLEVPGPRHMLMTQQLPDEGWQREHLKEEEI